MISAISKRIIDPFFGRGASAVTVPPLDGALLPNRLLDEAPLRIACQGVSNIALTRTGVLLAADNRLIQLNSNGSLDAWREFGHSISCLGGDDDAIAVGFDNGEVEVFGGPLDGFKVSRQAGIRCPTAATISGEWIYLCEGSRSRAPSDWRHDLMERNATGSVWSVNARTGQADRLATRLAYPNGIVKAGEDLIVSESWKHRLIRITLGGQIEEVLTDLPGYPGRITRRPDGGYLLALFAPRSQLVEFVLREHRFRRRMLETIDPDHWIAPSLRSGRTFYEPLQGGGVKHLGILKPWSPTRSFGVLAVLDTNFQPVSSYHSRADGKTHGITGAAEIGGLIFAVAAGDDVVVGLVTPETMEAATL